MLDGMITTFTTTPSFDHLSLSPSEQLDPSSSNTAGRKMNRRKVGL